MPGIIIKPVKVFTRDNPCTKVDLWNCFRTAQGFVPRPVVEARGEIGLNAPKYLRREGFCTLETRGDIDYYALTETGRNWLLEGVKRHLELHPEDRKKLAAPLPGTSARVRRARP